MILILFYIFFVWIRNLSYKKTFFKIDINKNIFSNSFIGLLSLPKKPNVLQEKTLINVMKEKKILKNELLEIINCRK